MEHRSTFSDLTDKDKIDFYIAIAVIMICGAFILFYSFSQTKVIDSISTITANSLEIDKVRVDSAAYIPITEEMLGRKKVEEITEIPTTQMPEEIASTSQNTSLERSPTESKTSEVKNTDSVQESESIANATSISNGVIKDSSKIEIQENPIANPTSKEVKTIERQDVNTDKDCIIIIGAFDKRKNIDKLKRSLKKDGYEIFTTPYKSLTRVGVKLPCNKVTIAKELTKIKAKYAKDAMVLRKEN